MFCGLALVASAMSLIIEEDLRKTNFNSSKVEHTATDRKSELLAFSDELKESEDSDEDD
jgi:hypothetical protein